jgi:hypothetical protein
MIFACLNSAVHVSLPSESAWTAVPTGLTPRGITELFNILDRDSGKYTFAVSCYMLELYQDDLADLLLPASQKQQGPQKVSITAVLFLPVIHPSLAPVSCWTQAGNTGPCVETVWHLQLMTAIWITDCPAASWLLPLAVQRHKALTGKLSTASMEVSFW